MGVDSGGVSGMLEFYSLWPNVNHLKIVMAVCETRCVIIVKYILATKTAAG